ncbi:MAG: TVP38/TMEM64 family protein [Oscillospiraceae bacterium]|nr:TVP38/TMEM64 family protein [Oscillospiraceae bacterium]
MLLFLALAAALLYFPFRDAAPQLLSLLKSGDVEEIQAYLRSIGTWKGVLVTALLQMLQVFSLVISGVPIQVAAGVIYGTFIALVICLLSSTLALTLSLLLWKGMGRRMKKWFPVEEKELRLINRLAESGTPPRYAVFLAGMIPVLPNGLIPLLASKLNISVPAFTLWVGLGSLPNMLLCCAIGNRLIRGDWLASIIYVVIMMGIVIVMWKWRDRIIAWVRSHARAQDGEKR